MRGALLAVTTTLALSACSSSPEATVERAAKRMNALHNKSLDSARAEGKTLVVRYKPLPLRQFSDAEIMKLSTAGLCTLDGVKDMLAKGASIRMEIPRGGDYLKVGVERCDGDQPILAKPDAPSATANAASANSGGGWPTSAPIENN